MVNITERPCFGWGRGRGGAGRRGREGKGEGAACLLRHRLSTIRSRRAATCRNATRHHQHSRNVVLRDAACIGAIESVLKSLGEYVYPQWIR